MNRMVCFLVLSAVAMTSCSHRDAEMTQNLNQVTMALIEAKQALVLSQVRKALADADALHSYNLAAFPEGISNPGKPTLVSYKSLGKGKVERVEFPAKHRKLASDLYETLQANGVLEKIAFVDVQGLKHEEQLAALRAADSSFHIEPVVKRGLDAINGDPRGGLCLTSQEVGACYCRAWDWDEAGNLRCLVWDQTT
jgi:hypothetical protein